jgi:hypothetical protein
MPRVPTQRNNKSRLVLISVLAVIIAAGALYFLFAGEPKSEKAIEEVFLGEEQRPALRKAEPPPLPPVTAKELVPDIAEAPESAATPPQRSCPQAYGKLAEFFSHLDNGPYVAFHQPGGSEAHLAELLTDLFANPPVLVRETDSLFTILRNTAHFYRVMGPSNIFLFKEILEEESEIIETVMADFHNWSLTAPECGPGEYAIRLPLEHLYEYAGYFLNTLGGQSYLFRRPPRIRTLTKYYSVLILDQANEQELNRFGIDIRPALDSLISEMEATQNLSGRHEYLALLQNLRIKYRNLYGH